MNFLKFILLSDYLSVERKRKHMQVDAAASKRDGRELTAAIASALGLPKTTVRATLTLCVDSPPVIELSMIAVDSVGNTKLEAVLDGVDGSIVERLAACGKMKKTIMLGVVPIGAFMGWL